MSYEGIFRVLLFGKYFLGLQSIFWVVQKYPTPLIPVCKYAKSIPWDLSSTKHHSFYYIFIISQLWLTSHPRSTEVLLDAGTLGTSREIYSEDADDGLPGGELDRDQRSWVLLDDRGKYFATDRKPKTIPSEK